MAHLLQAAKYIAQITLVALALTATPTHAQTLEDDVADLLDHCRISIETHTPFDSDGLTLHPVADRHTRNWGNTTTHTAWRRPTSDVYAVISEWTPDSGRTRRLCNLHLVEQNRILDAVEQGLILRQFLVLQTRLIGNGTHAVDPGLSAVPPLINAALLMSARNPNGCSVTTMLTLSEEGTFFMAGSGEQTIQDC